MNEKYRKVFKNVPVEGKPVREREYYGTITTSKGSFLVTHTTTNRSVAVAEFEKAAKTVGGTLDNYIGSF